MGRAISDGRHAPQLIGLDVAPGYRRPANKYETSAPLRDMPYHVCKGGRRRAQRCRVVERCHKARERLSIANGVRVDRLMVKGPPLWPCISPTSEWQYTRSIEARATVAEHRHLGSGHSVQSERYERIHGVDEGYGLRDAVMRGCPSTGDEPSRGSDAEKSRRGDAEKSRRGDAQPSRRGSLGVIRSCCRPFRVARDGGYAGGWGCTGG